MEIYSAARNELEAFLFQMERLKEQGFDMGDLPDEAFERLKELVEEEDARKLETVRKELSKLTWTDEYGQEYYFDYPIGEKNERKTI